MPSPSTPSHGSTGERRFVIRETGRPDESGNTWRVHQKDPGPLWDGDEIEVVPASQLDHARKDAAEERARWAAGEDAFAVEQNRADKLQAQLAECYRLTGSDPDGDSDSMLASQATAAVKEVVGELEARVEELEGERDASVARIYELLRAVELHRLLPVGTADRDSGLYENAEQIARKVPAAPRRWSFEYQAAFDETVTDLIRAIRHEFPDGKVEAHWLDESSGGSVNGRKALGRILRAAVKHGVVSVTPDQAAPLAHSGSAGHGDTAADLLAATPPPNGEDQPSVSDQFSAPEISQDCGGED